MTPRVTVNRLDRAQLGVPEGCPRCGGRLAPCFGEIVHDDGRRMAALDPSVARCLDCGEQFQTK